MKIVLVNIRFHSVLGAGQQCCYDGNGDILPYENGGGTLQVAHYKGYVSRDIVRTPSVSHLLEDVKPHFLCCKLSDNCRKYGDVRPTDDCKTYLPPIVGM